MESGLVSGSSVFLEPDKLVALYAVDGELGKAESHAVDALSFSRFREIVAKSLEVSGIGQIFLNARDLRYFPLGCQRHGFKRLGVGLDLIIVLCGERFEQIFGIFELHLHKSRPLGFPANQIVLLGLCLVNNDARCG